MRIVLIDTGRQVIAIDAAAGPIFETHSPNTSRHRYCRESNSNLWVNEPFSCGVY